MTIQPTSIAKDSEIQLQVMLSGGESVKGNAQEGKVGNYFEKKVSIIFKVCSIVGRSPQNVPL